MARKKLVLCDSNIIIHLLNGREDIGEALNKIGWENLCISVITEAEVLYGAQSKLNFAHIQRLLGKFTIYPISNEISNIFRGLILKYTV